MPDKTHHTAICGPSDGGKSTRMREHHETFDGVSIVVNHGDESKIVGYRARGPQAMATGVDQFEDWSDVRINLITNDPLEGVELAIRFAIDVWDTAGVPVQIILDEAHNAFPSDVGETPQENPVIWALDEGRDKGIKIVLVTQNPKNMPYKKLDSVKYWVWVGEWSNPMEGFLKYYGFLEDIPGEQFHVTVFDRTGEVLEQTTTDKDYT